MVTDSRGEAHLGGLDNKAKQEVQAMAKPNVDSALEDFLETHAGMQVTAAARMLPSAYDESSSCFLHLWSTS